LIITGWACASATYEKRMAGIMMKYRIECSV
jgi:hypothetical protein